MTRKCIQLCEFLQVERDIIVKHIDDHKWCRKIPDYNQGVADFITNYGWLMREMFCGHICEHRQDCQMARELIESEKKEQAIKVEAS